MLVDDEMRQCLEEIINENCVLTLSQVNGELRRRLPAKPLIHDRTVARNLEDFRQSSILSKKSTEAFNCFSKIQLVGQKNIEKKHRSLVKARL